MTALLQTTDLGRLRREGPASSAAPRPDRSLRHIFDGATALDATLNVPPDAQGIVLFSVPDPAITRRHLAMVQAFRHARFGTLLVDLITPAEERREGWVGTTRSDVPLLTRRVLAALDWLAAQLKDGLRVGIYGVGTGAAAALRAAAERPPLVSAVVSRAGRADLAGAWLVRVEAPTLLLVPAWDGPLVDLNHEAYEQLRGEKRLEVFGEEPPLSGSLGAFELVAARSQAWFAQYLARPKGTQEEVFATL